LVATLIRVWRCFSASAWSMSATIACGAGCGAQPAAWKQPGLLPDGVGRRSQIAPPDGNCSKGFALV
jgi:hypothetical protein